MTNSKTIFVFVALVAATNCSSFSEGAPKPIVGAKGGMNRANIGGDTDNKSKIAPHMGIYTEVFF
jgi:hypothetical protein